MTSFFEEFRKVILSDSFLSFVLKANDLLESLVIDGYKRNEHEPVVVEKIVNVFNKLTNGVVTLDRKYYLRVDSVFIHGNKSHVEFEYFGKSVIKELGDILFLVYLKSKTSPMLKVSIIQVKKSPKESLYWDIDNGQLYLLSNFPKIQGKKGLFKGFCGKLTNISKNLGGYILLNDKLGMLYSSAVPIFETTWKLKDTNRIHRDELDCLFGLYRNPPPFTRCCVWFERCFNFPLCYFSVPGNRLIAENSFCFLAGLFSFSIGEPVYLRDQYAFTNFLGNLYASLVVIRKQEVIEFLNRNKSFWKHFDGVRFNEKDHSEDGGIGIVFVELGRE